MEGICNKEEKDAYNLWAVKGTSPKGFEHLLAKHKEVTTPTVHNETVVLTHPQAVPLQKGMIVSTTTYDAPKSPDLTDYGDPLGPVQTYNSYYRVKQKRYQEGQRPKPPTFKEKMSTTWPQSYPMSGCYKNPSG